MKIFGNGKNLIHIFEILSLILNSTLNTKVYNLHGTMSDFWTLLAEFRSLTMDFQLVLESESESDEDLVLPPTPRPCELQKKDHKKRDIYAQAVREDTSIIQQDRQRIFSCKELEEYKTISKDYKHKTYKTQGAYFTELLYMDPKYKEFFAKRGNVKVKRGNVAKNWRELDESCNNSDKKLANTAIRKRPFLCKSLEEAKTIYLEINIRTQ
jgi:hypothetical protein